MKQRQQLSGMPHRVCTASVVSDKAIISLGTAGQALGPEGVGLCTD